MPRRPLAVLLLVLGCAALCVAGQPADDPLAGLNDSLAFDPFAALDASAELNASLDATGAELNATAAADYEGPLDSPLVPTPAPLPLPSSILDELLRWQVQDLTQLSDPTIAAPKPYLASCNMLCSVGWEEDLAAPTFTKRKVLRCSTANLAPIQFDAATECDAESGFCQRVLAA
jgi:hypothetical protein